MAKYLTLKEALVALGSDQKIRITYWDKGHFIYLRDGKKLVNQDGNSARFIMSSGSEYELYEEFEYPMWFEGVNTIQSNISKFLSLNHRIGVSKKTLIKVAKYAIYLKSGWEDSYKYYKSDSEFEAFFGDVTYKRLGYTEIEVEED